MLGEFLYRLAPQELRGQAVVQRIAVGVKPSLQVSSAAAFVQSLPFLVPLDKIALITSVMALATAGAAQTCDRLDLFLNTDGTLSTSCTIASAQFAAALNQRVTWFPVNLVLMSNESLTVGGNFNAGAAANTVGLHVTALLLPKGNVQLR